MGKTENNNYVRLVYQMRPIPLINHKCDRKYRIFFLFLVFHHDLMGQFEKKNLQSYFLF